MWILLAVLTFAQAGERRALLVGLSDYSYDDSGKNYVGWRDLAGAEDAAAMRSTLLYRGFRPENIEVLTDAQATADAVRSALTELAARTKKGDHVVFYYSGHGYRLPDDDEDDHEEGDGFDEVLVTHGAPSKGLKDYEGTEYVRDDDLGEALDALQDAAGNEGSVVFLLDSCHSGTAGRGEKNEEEEEGLRGLPPARAPVPAAPPEDGVGFVTLGATDAKRAAVLSAGKAGESAQQVVLQGGVKRGAFTWAVTTILETRPDITTWSQVQATADEMVRSRGRQHHPQIEGMRDLPIFDEEARPTELSWIVEPKSREPGTWFVHGAFVTLREGDVLDLYPVATVRREGKPVARGTLTEIGDPSSEMAIKAKKDPRDTYPVLRAFLKTEADAGESWVRVAIADDLPEASKWAKAAEAIRGVGVTEQASWVLRPHDDAVGLFYEDEDEPRSTSTTTDPVESAVLRSLQALVTAETLFRSRSVGGPNHLTKVTLDPKRVENKRCVADERDGDPWMRGDGTALEFTVTNKSAYPRWITVFDRAPDGSASFVAAEEVAGGKPWTKCLAIQPDEPVGQHTLRFLTTRSELHLAPFLAMPEADMKARGDEGERQPMGTAGETLDIPYDVRPIEEASP